MLAVAEAAVRLLAQVALAAVVLVAQEIQELTELPILVVAEAEAIKVPQACHQHMVVQA
jgi:hypothetical protein